MVAASADIVSFSFSYLANRMKNHLYDIDDILNKRQKIDGVEFSDEELDMLRNDIENIQRLISEGHTIDQASRSRLLAMYSNMSDLQNPNNKYTKRYTELLKAYIPSNHQIGNIILNDDEIIEDFDVLS